MFLFFSLSFERNTEKCGSSSVHDCPSGLETNGLNRVLRLSVRPHSIQFRFVFCNEFGVRGGHLVGINCLVNEREMEKM